MKLDEKFLGKTDSLIKSLLLHELENIDLNKLKEYGNKYSDIVLYLLETKGLDTSEIVSALEIAILRDANFTYNDLKNNIFPQSKLAMSCFQYALTVHEFSPEEIQSLNLGYDFKNKNSSFTCFSLCLPEYMTEIFLQKK